MHIHPMSDSRTIHPFCNHLQESVGTAPHAAPQGRHTLAEHGLEAVSVPLGEHPLCAASPGQPQHPPEGVVVLDTQSTEGILGVVAPQVNTFHF
jgi:hypothetical protein